MCGLINRALFFFSSPPLFLSRSLRRSVSFGLRLFLRRLCLLSSIFFLFWLASSDFALLFLTSIFYQSYQSTSYHDQYWARDAVSHSRSYLHASPIYVISVHLSPATLYHVQNLLPELPLRLTFTSISFNISSSTISLLRQLGLFMPTTREHTCSFVQIRARTTS